MFVVTTHTYEAALAQQKAHYEQLIEQERAHHKEIVAHLKATLRAVEKQRDRYRDELWQKREGKPFTEPVEEPVRQLTEAEAFKEWEAMLNQDELDLLAYWRAEMLSKGHEVEELSGLYRKQYGDTSPLVALTV